jgi:LacI family transcriptional regulator
MQSHGCKETEAYCAEILLGKRVDGLVVASLDDQNDLGRLRPYIQKNIPVVLLGNAGNEQAFVNILTDNRKAGYEMTRHLLGLGRRRIVHLTSDGTFKGHEDRCEGYKQALVEAGLPVKERYIIRCGLSRQDGMVAAEAVWQWMERPDAIFAGNDHCAVGFILALRKRGVRIPAEIAIAGFGNDPVSSASDPELTTVGYPGQQMGEAAVNQLMCRMQGSNSVKLIDTIVLRSNLIIRKSTLIS